YPGLFSFTCESFVRPKKANAELLPWPSGGILEVLSALLTCHGSWPKTAFKLTQSGHIKPRLGIGVPPAFWR
ncbi:MAG: hypothetical protein SWN10_23840, partial [Pseudomonadota bacterium]|nr:hypothetical protein [Pseudomonadota bacterium]